MVELSRLHTAADHLTAITRYRNAVADLL